MIETLVGARIDLRLEASAESCVVHADPNQFDTAIVSMVVNARDAMGGAGSLIIAVRRTSIIPRIRNHSKVESDFVTIALSDSGEGIRADRLDHIFEPLFTTKEVGLGLSEVFGFAKQSGGEIEVESVPGTGSSRPCKTPPTRMNTGCTG